MRSLIIKRSILAETVPAFAVNLAVFTFILLMARAMQLADLVITSGVSTVDVAWIILLVMPKMLSMSVPMAALLAPLTTFLRMSADSEITVLKASGVSLYQLLAPVALFGLAAGALTGLFNVYLTPAANLRFRAEILALAKARADLAIKEQVFVRDFPGLTIYVGQLPSRTEEMENVFISDRRLEGENTVIVASRGMLDIDREEGLLLFRLVNGVIDRMHETRKSVDSIFFETYELKISPGTEFASEEGGFAAGRSELPTSQLPAETERLRAAGLDSWVDYAIEYHRRYAFPVAAFLMAVIGMPLGASFRARGRNFGLGVGLVIFVVYYSVFSLGISFASAGSLPPAPAVWSANAIALVLALLLLKGINRSSAIDPRAAARRFWSRVLGRTTNGRHADDDPAIAGPAADATRQGHVSDTASQGPVTDAAGRAPATDAVGQGPAADTASQGPATDTASHGPAADAAGRGPEADAAGRDGTADRTSREDGL
ncbi:MAG: LPS export ABC transporter permease LptF [Deltaproteobacteria bacterium]|jgi:lipopolysaccharide export system permease protein|nr:LPS export ABC transporter permease LptF [Deltaproteobacteria bacterium]